MFVSLKKYWDQAPLPPAPALLRMVQMLLRAVGQGAIGIERLERERFQQDILALDQGLGEHPSGEQILVASGAAVKTIEDYSHRAARVIEAHSLELEQMVALLTKVVSEVSAASDQTASRLHEIEQRLHKVQMLEDLASIKTNLLHCVELVRDETRRHRRESAEAISQLKKDLHQCRTMAGTPVNPGLGADASDPLHNESGQRIDPLTRLPDQPEAEKAIAAGVKQGRHVFAALFLCRHVPLINGRFGFDVGNQVLLLAKQHLMRALFLGSELFKWSGRAFLALLERRGDADQVRKELRRLTATRVEGTLRVGDRSLLLPVTISCEVFPLYEYLHPRDLVQQVDKFIYNQDHEYSRAPIVTGQGPS